MEEAEGLHREHIEAGATVDEGFGDGHPANGGRAEHRERARAGGVYGVVVRVEGQVGLGCHPTRGSSLPREGGADLAKELLGVAV